ncbi:MAG: Trypsin-like peptidase domain [Gaiellaceae bacterium]|nr:Trypsin-like peptidase domain [Gaiellaceae bacterium]
MPDRGDSERLRAVGSVLARRDGAWRRAGSCFAVRERRHVLTAGHCVEGLLPADVEVSFVVSPERCTSVAIVRHPSADLALIRLGDGAARLPVAPFTGVGRVAEWGSEFVGFGSAVHDGSLAEAGERLFAGRVRRVFSDPADGHRYADMSVGAGDGFSGGPLFAPSPPYPVVGLITGNRQSRISLLQRRITATLGLERRHTPDGHGIALLVGELAEWIDAHLPSEPRLEGGHGADVSC